MNTGLDQYIDIFKDAVEDSAAKITKSFCWKTRSFRKNGLMDNSGVFYKVTRLYFELLCKR